MLLKLLYLSYLLYGTLSRELIRETLTGRGGDFVSLRCGARSGDVTWFKTINGEGKDVTTLPDRRYIVMGDGTLYINRLRESDKGLYTCRKAKAVVKEVTVEIASRPRIAVAPSDTTAHRGDLVHLRCEGAGEPKPIMKWRIYRGILRNLTSIPDNLTEKEILGHNGGNFLITEAGHLYIRDPVAEYSATYVCTATNAGGTAWVTAQVLILEPPKITTRPQDTNSIDGESVGLDCRAIGNPPPKITWRLETPEGNAIEELENHPSKRYELDPYKTLVIRSPLPSDSGNYTCVATNLDGVAEASAILRVLFRETRAGREGGFVSLKCSTFDDVTWFKTINGEKNDIKTLQDKRYIVARDGSFFISRLRETDAGVYSCYNAGSVIKEVTVEIASLPRIAIAPSDIIVHLGDLVHLQCEAEGNPQPMIKWRVGRSFLKNIPVIPDNLTEKEILNHNGGNFLVTEAGHLYIRDLVAAFSTTYICMAKNVGGSTWATAQVLILEPPIITTRPRDTSSLDGESVRLGCRATGNPPPEITWRLETPEGIIIEELENHPSRRYELDPYKTLRIRFPLPSDSGNYTCVATNDDGVAEASANLQVHFRETRISREGGFVFLRCGTFNDVTWFKIINGEKRDINTLSDRRYIMARDGWFFISRLRVSDVGVYWCQSEGVLVKMVTVEIASQPRIAIAPSDVTVHLGELVHLQCEAAGNPKPDIEWRVGRSFLRNIPVIPDNLTEKEILNYNGGNFLITQAGHLYVRHPTTAYSTRYICKASSIGGSTWATAQVLILEPPRITVRPKDTNYRGGDSVGLTCRATGNPPPEITWRLETPEGIVIEELENHPSRRYELDPYKTLRIRFPLPSDSGNYTCTAINDDGVAEASAILQVPPDMN